MNERIYVGNLCNWNALTSRFELDRTEPYFVYVALDSDGTRYLELATWTDDGHRFSFAAAEGACRGGQETLIGPSSCSAKRLREKLVRLSPLAWPHLPALSAWRRHVSAPRDLPQVVEVVGPQSGVLRVLRNGLDLSGARLAEALSHGGRVRVSPTQLFALKFWCDKIPGVAIRRSPAGVAAYTPAA